LFKYGTCFTMNAMQIAKQGIPFAEEYLL
jgi:hypothetical protein